MRKEDGWCCHTKWLLWTCFREMTVVPCHCLCVWVQGNQSLESKVGTWKYISPCIVVVPLRTVEWTFNIRFTDEGNENEESWCLNPFCAAITEFLRWGNLQRRFISCSSEGWEVQSQRAYISGECLFAVSSHGGRQKGKREQAWELLSYAPLPELSLVPCSLQSWHLLACFSKFFQPLPTAQFQSHFSILRCLLIVTTPLSVPTFY